MIERRRAGETDREFLDRVIAQSLRLERENKAYRRLYKALAEVRMAYTWVETLYEEDDDGTE